MRWGRKESNKMKKVFSLLILAISLHAHSQVKHFFFIGMDRDLLKDTSTWASPIFDGVQIAYSWRQLEHEKDHYDFSMIDEDVALLKKHGKKLFIQIQDVSFSMKYNHAPEYILSDAAYHGGANKQYKFKDDNESTYKELGWVTRRWDPAVQKRLHKLYRAIGNQFDEIIEGINTEETAVDFGKGPLHPPGFSFKRYKEAVIENLAALKKAFPKSLVLVYANFMPGGFLPYQDSSFMKDIYQFAIKKHIGIGGPDLLPYKPDQMTNSYGFIRNSSEKVPAGVAVQDGTYQYINPRTKATITAADIYTFGKDYLGLKYFFWGSEEPFLHTEIIPFLKSLQIKKGSLSQIIGSLFSSR
jgi:hypothetical protein